MKIIWISHQTPTEDSDTLRRQYFARLSIENESKRHNNCWIECKQGYSRDARSIGDPKELPFIRDMIEGAMKLVESEDDIVVLINADICVIRDITLKLKDACSNGGASWAHRYDCKRIDQLFENQSDLDNKSWYCGSDMFAMTRQWWNNHNHKFPDAVLGREAWDMMLRRTIRENGGIECFKCIYHEWHVSPWEVNRELAGNVHNRNLASQWLAANGGDYFDWKN